MWLLCYWSFVTYYKLLVSKSLPSNICLRSVLLNKLILIERRWRIVITIEKKWTKLTRGGHRREIGSEGKEAPGVAEIHFYVIKLFMA